MSLKTPQHIAAYTKNNEVKRLVQKIKEIEHEIHKTEEAFLRSETSSVQNTERKEDITGVNSFEQWHSHHDAWRNNSGICGRSTKSKSQEVGPGEGYFTTFKQKKRHFGPVGLHKGFESQAMSMTRGRITR